MMADSPQRWKFAGHDQCRFLELFKKDLKRRLRNFG
jgi:hypothetical protein